MRQELTQARLKEVLQYDPETGVFTWKLSTGSRAVAGRRAGLARGPHGYRSIGVLGKRYAEHWLAFLYMTGAWPEDEVDHKNGVPGDNRWDNLRLCNHEQNHQNRRKPDGWQNTTQGVSWHKLRSKWRADICHKGRQKALGLFDTPEEAHQAYLTAKAQLHTFQPTPRIATT